MVFGLIAMGAAYIFINGRAIDSYSSLFAHASGVLVVEMLLFYLFLFDAEERQRLRRVLLKTVGV